VTIAACSSAIPARQGSVTVAQSATAWSGRSSNRGRRRSIVPSSLHEGADVVRSDAEENVQRLLRAARDAVGEEGAGVGVRAIAERAGVGVTTLYRHFRDKWALIDGVAVHRWSALRTLAERPVPAGGELARIVLLLDTFTRMLAADDRLITGAGWRVGRSPAALLVPAKAGYDAALLGLWVRAQTGGTVHRRADPRDVMELAGCLRDASRRPAQLRLLVSGLSARPEVGEPLVARTLRLPDPGYL
jgi:AcrR family transcriptional regulator